jgi:hypothetical protein
VHRVDHPDGATLHRAAVAAASDPRLRSMLVSATVTNPAGDPTRQPDAPNTTPRGVALFRVN